MAKGSISKNRPGVQGVYVFRRILLLVIAIMIILLAFFLMSNDLSVRIAPTPQPANGTQIPAIRPPPVFEEPSEPPPIITPEEEPQADDGSTQAGEGCIESPVPGLGCLEENGEQDIFDAEGMRLTDKNVKKVIELVEERCDTGGSDGTIDTECIVDTAITKSDKSWLCEWECLQDLASCETYKMHLAIAVLRKYVPATDAFVGRTDEFQFLIMFKGNDGEWIQPQYVFIKNPQLEAIYNDVYHAGPITEVVFPQILEVGAGDKFCFNVYAPRSCVCTVEVTPFIVGECPQLPADLKGICSAPVGEKYLSQGDNEICFTVADNATENFYTYRFSLTGGDEWIPAGNAFIRQRSWDCCVNASFEGFLDITD